MANENKTTRPKKTTDAKSVRQVTRSINFDVAVLQALDKAAAADKRKRSPFLNLLLRKTFELKAA